MAHIRKEAILHVEANRRLGQAVYQFLTEQHDAARIDYPRFVVGTLAEVLDTTIYVMLPRMRELQDLSPEVIDLLIGTDPVFKFHYNVYAPMSWAATLGPVSHQQVVQIAPVLQDFLRQRGCGEVSPHTIEVFNDRLLELMAVPEAAGQLSASGYAIYQAATRQFRSLPTAKSGTARRRRCLQDIRQLCFEIEAGVNMATGRGLGVRIAEILGAELRASNYARRRHEIEIFWRKFDLFFHGSRFI